MATPRSLFGNLRLCIGLGILFAGCAANFAQLASEELVTRTFKFNPSTNLSALAENGRFEFFPPTQPPSRKEEIRAMLLAAGVDLRDATSVEERESRKAFFYNERTGALMVRATVAELDIIENAIRALSTPPQVQLEMQYVESSRNDIDLTFAKTGTAPGTGVLTERQYRLAMEALKNAQGVNVISTPAITTISGRQARLRAEQPAPPPYQTPPRLPKDTRPHADPTPRNKERLPFPPTFVPEGFPADAPR